MRIREILLFILLAGSVAAQDLWDQEAQFAPFRLQARVSEWTLCDQVDGTATADGGINAILTTYLAAGTPGTATVQRANATPTARRGSGFYTEVINSAAAGDYIEWNFGSAYALNEHNYLSFFIQSDATTVAAVNAQGTLALTGQPLTTETFAINGYTWTLQTTDDTITARVVVIGASTGATCLAIVAAINSASYGTGVSATTTAAAGDATGDVIVTYDTYGTGGNAVTFAEAMTNATVDAATLGTTTLGVEPTYIMWFENGAGSAVGSVPLPAIATASVWTVMEVPLYGIQRRSVQYINWEDNTGANDTIQVEKMMLSEYANGGGPVHAGALAAQVQLKYGATTVVRGDLIGRDAGTLAYEMDQGVSNENFIMGYVIGGAGGGGGVATESILIQLTGQKYIQCGATPGILASEAVYASGVRTVDGTSTSAVSLGTACEDAASAGYFVEVELGIGAGLPSLIPAASIAPGDTDQLLQTQAGVVVWTDDILVDSIDNDVAAAITIGGTTATDIDISRSGEETDILGTLSVDEAAEFDATLTMAADQVITLTAGTGEINVNSTVTNASAQAVDIAPIFTGGATDLLTYTAIDIADQSPTNAAGTDTVNGLAIGTMTDPGATITSVGFQIGAGWDTGFVNRSTTDLDNDLDWDGSAGGEIVTFDCANVLSADTALFAITDARTGVNSDVIAEVAFRVSSAGVYGGHFIDGSVLFSEEADIIIEETGGADLITLAAVAQTAAATVSIPDVGGASTFVMSTTQGSAAQAVDGLWDCASVTVDAGGAGIDTATAGILNIGPTTANDINVAQSGVETDLLGTLSCDEAAVFDSTVDVDGALTLDGLNIIAAAEDEYPALSITVADDTGNDTPAVGGININDDRTGAEADANVEAAFVVDSTATVGTFFLDGSVVFAEEADISIEETGGADLITLVAVAQTTAATASIPDIGGASTFVMSTTQGSAAQAVDGLWDCASVTVDAGGAGIDTATAGILNIGPTTANDINIAQSGVEFDILGTLSCDEAALFDATLETDALLDCDGTVDVDTEATAGTVWSITTQDVAGAGQTAHPLLITIADNSAEANNFGGLVVNDNRAGTEASAAAESAVQVHAGTGYDLYLQGGRLSMGQASTANSLIDMMSASDNFIVSITRAASASSRVYSVPDAGGAADFVMNAGTATVAGAKTFSSAILDSANVGAAGLSGTATEYGDGYHHTTVISGISFSHAVGMAAEAVTGVVYTFPEGAIVVHSVMFDGHVYSASITDTAEAFGVGTAAAADDATLVGTEEDLLRTGALDGAITTTPGVVHQDVTATGTPFWDGTGAAITANINMTDTAWNAADTIFITGTLTIVWDFVGDF